MDPSLQKMDSHFLHDIWTADMHGSRLVLGDHLFIVPNMSLISHSGTGLQAVMVEDIAVSTSFQRLHTGSDVLALAQRDVRVHFSFVSHHC